MGRTPSGENRSSAATESTGVVPIAARSARAVSTVASAFVASTTRSDDRHASAFAAPLTPTEPAGGLGGPRGVARSDHDVVARFGDPLREREAEAARAADEGDLHAAASSTISARRRAASRSVINVPATTSGTGASAGRVGGIDDEDVDEPLVTPCYVRR